MSQSFIGGVLYAMDASDSLKPGSYSSPTSTELVIRIFVHGFLFACIASVLALAVPSFEKAFDEYQLSLPGLTKAMLSASHWLTQQWFVVAVVVIPALTVEWIVLSLLSITPSFRRFVRLLCAGITALLLLTNVMIAIAFVLPWIKLQEALAR